MTLDLRDRFPTVELGPNAPSGAPIERAVALGVFDGVHVGHRQLLARVREAADRLGVSATVATFDPHPRAVVADAAPPQLCTLRRRIELVESVGGVDECAVLQFSETVSRLSPSAFVDEVLCGALGARQLVVGCNFRFGHGREGDVDVLTDLGERRGFSVEAVDLVAPPELGAATRISSTLIRQKLAGGDVDFGRRALGRAHEVEGWINRPDGFLHDAPALVEPLPNLCVPGAGLYHAQLLGHGAVPARSATVAVGERGSIEIWDVPAAEIPLGPVVVRFLNRASL